MVTLFSFPVITSLIAFANLKGSVFVKDCDEPVNSVIKSLWKFCSVEL